jgi:PAS domain S-box-containing protein
MKPNGGKRHLDVTKFPILDHTGDVAGIGTICNDITDRKIAENSLKLSEERFRSLFEHSTMGIFVHRNYKLMTANPAAAEMYGYDSVEDFLTVKSTQDLTVPEHHSYDNAKRMRGEQTVAVNEHLGIKKDGSNFWVRKRTFVINWDGEPATCTIREDVTLAKESENVLRESEARFRGAIEGLQEGFALYDANDNLVMCNDEFRNLHTHCPDYIKPGMSFEAMTRFNAYNGHNTDAAGR